MLSVLTPRPADPPLSFCFEVRDSKSQRREMLEFKHTRHSAVRAAQRGIDTGKIACALQYGECLCKQKLLYYILGEKNIPAELKMRKELINLVVIVAGDSNQVVTCYRSNNPFKHIRRKSKRLSSPRAAA